MQRTIALTYCIPGHILDPRPNGLRYFLSRLLSGWSHRSGRNRSGSGKSCGSSWWSLDVMLTGTFQQVCFKLAISDRELPWVEREEAVSTYSGRYSPLVVLYVARFVYSGQPWANAMGESWGEILILAHFGRLFCTVWNWCDPTEALL